MKALRIIFLLVLTLAIWMAVRQYLFCPQFSFVKGKPFSGNKLYNPYAFIDSCDWVKCNFHAHTNAWKGLTNGRGTASDVWRFYDSLGYGVHAVSDYNIINDEFRDRENYIPAYEHGYNFKKTHELVLGTHEVKWLDYVFPQTLSNKQYILNQLSRETGNVVTLNHPAVTNGFNEDDMNYLGNYHCIEVLNPWGISFHYWDAALSAGKPVFIMGNDDTHNACQLCSIGQYCTWVNVPLVNCKNILTALKTGNAYGMHIPLIPGEKIEKRIKRLKYDLPALKKFSVTHDTIEVTITQPAKQILFIGQHGKILKAVGADSKAIYPVGQQDNYVRTAITFPDGTEIFLNPVFRYSGSSFSDITSPMINLNKTLYFFFSGLIIFSAWCSIVIFIFFGNFFRRKLRAELLQESPYPILR
jgi:hypothetical protein